MLNTNNIYFIAAIVNLFSFCTGAAFSWTSPVLPKLRNLDNLNNPLSRQITSSESGLIAGLLQAGCAVGPLISGKFTKTFGRKVAFLGVASTFLIAFTILSFANYLYLFYLGRFFQGIGIGFVFQIVPLYLGEISSKNLRGKITSSMAFFYSIGMLSSLIMGPYMSIKVFSLIYTVPPIMFIICYKLLPESPVYYILKGDTVKAKLVLLKLRTLEVVAEELKEIEEYCDNQNKQTYSPKYFIQNYLLKKAFFVCLGITLIHNVCGVSSFTSYMQEIFIAAGSTYIPPNISPIMIGIVKVFSGFFGSAVIDRTGRRKLLLLSTIVCGVTIFILGLYFKLLNYNVKVYSVSWLPTLCLAVYMVSYTGGILPVSFTYLSEIFPPEIKCLGSSICISFAYMFSFLLTYIFPLLIDFAGMAWAIWFFCGICILITIFVYFCAPETKGKSLTEIKEMLK